MPELSQTADKPQTWVFRTPILCEIHKGTTQDGIRTVFMVSAYRYVDVEERLAFDARRKAARILGVDPLSVEQVSCPI